MRRTRLRPVSDKRLAEREQRDDVRETTLRRAMFRCQAPGAFGIRCSGVPDVHELQGRGVRPGGHLDPANCVALCRRHHDHVTTHPQDARIAGLRYESWEQLPG
jgi:hypothetical protein